MRLINTATLDLKEFLGEPNKPQFPRYAVLSHTWGEGEVTFQDMQNKEVAQGKAGYGKIVKCCEIARDEGLGWAWVDTCCIDKTSSAELSEAINSMFKWYEHSTICYAYLSDVEVSGSDIQHLPRATWTTSRWFTRGWTLQELIAPFEVVIYDRKWKQLGTKRRLASGLERRTSIPEKVLLNPSCRRNYSVAARMSWATGRATTRSEDGAYALLGLFDVNMPLLYGEGHKAFLRLHREILSTIEDDTIFLGGLAPRSALNVWYFTCNTENHFLATPGNLCDESVASIRPLPSNADRMTTQWHSSAGKLQRNDPKKDPRLRGDVVSMPLRIIQVVFPNRPSPNMFVTMKKLLQLEPDSIDQKTLEQTIFDPLRSGGRSLCLGMLRCGTDRQLVARYFMCLLVNDELVANPLPVYRLVSADTVDGWPYMQCHISLNIDRDHLPRLKSLRDPVNWGFGDNMSTIIFGNGWTSNQIPTPPEIAKDDDIEAVFAYTLHLERNHDVWDLILTHREPYTIEITLRLQRRDPMSESIEVNVVDNYNEREGHVTELYHRLPVRNGSAELVVSVYYEIDGYRHFHSPMIRFRAFEPTTVEDTGSECEANGWSLV